MNDQEFSQKMKDMDKPNPLLPKHEQKLRIAYMDAKKSAWWGLLLIILPTLFVGYNVSKYVIGLSFLPDVNTFFPTRIGDIILNTVLPFVFLGGGLAAVILNLLAVLHVESSHTRHAWNVTVSVRKEKWNLIILSIITAVLSILVLYALVENL